MKHLGSWPYVLGFPVVDMNMRSKQGKQWLSRKSVQGKVGITDKDRIHLARPGKRFNSKTFFHTQFVAFQGFPTKRASQFGIPKV